MRSVFTVNRQDFGPDFTFGVATASHQIEGALTEDGRGPSIWDTFSRTPGNVKGGDVADPADDSYHRWAEDLDLIRDGGFDAYRFSISWSRILPAGTGETNQKGIDYYDRLIDGMLERGIKPFLTCYHWDLPSTLQDKGGWMNRDVAGWLADYAAVLAHHYGDRVEAVATINEPWCVSFLSHYLGIHAPGYRDIRAAARAMHHVLLAHGTAVGALRANGVKKVGIVTNLQKVEPVDNDPRHNDAVELYDGIFNGWFLGGLYKGQYPKAVVDFLSPHLPAGFEKDMAMIAVPLDWAGINYYSRSLVAADPESPTGMKIIDGPLEHTDIGWEIYPKGLTDLLVRVSQNYTKIPIFVTENGMAEVNVEDDFRRVTYYDAHLRAVLDARAQGADVRGYFAWSLLDNFEWAEGYSKRFGIVGVDYATQARTPRASYRAFQGMLHNTR
jgi:beta-glucosidase